MAQLVHSLFSILLIAMYILFVIEGAILGAVILRSLALILSTPVDLQPLRFLNFAPRVPLISISGISKIVSPFNFAATKFLNVQSSLLNRMSSAL